MFPNNTIVHSRSVQEIQVLGYYAVQGNKIAIPEVDSKGKAVRFGEMVAVDINNDTTKAPSVTGATTDEDTMTSNGLVITPHEEDGAKVTHYKITNISGGRLYKNDGTTEIYNNDYITAAEGAAGLKFLPDADLNTAADGPIFHFDVQAALDNFGSGLSEPTTVQIIVTEVNDAPTAVDDKVQDIDEDTILIVSIEELLENDRPGPKNESGQRLKIIDVSTPILNSTVTVVGDSVIFTPAANYYGAAQFKYTIQDNGITGKDEDFKTATATVTFNVNPVPDTLSVTPVITAEDTQSSSGLVISRNTVDGSGVTHFLITGITGGTLYFNDGVTPISNGQYITVAQGGAGLRFTPAKDLNSPSGDTFHFQIQASTDAVGTRLSPIATATITVHEVNDAPEAVDDTLSRIKFGSGEKIIDFQELLANDHAGAANETGQTLNISEVKNAVGGSVKIEGSNVVFTPDVNFIGTASFTYTVADNGTTYTALDPKNNIATVSFDIYVPSELQSLAIQSESGNIPLTPTFSESITTYDVTVANSVNEVTLTPTAFHNTVQIEVNGSPVISGTETAKIPLNVGQNQIQIEVTAPGEPTTIYTVNITRQSPPSNNNDNDYYYDSNLTTPLKTQQRNAQVRLDGSTEIISIDIIRTISASGVIDSVVITEAKADEILTRSQRNGTRQVRIVIEPVPEALATEVEVKIPAKAMEKVKEAGVDLIIEAEGVEITLQSDSIRNMGTEEDLYFRIVPLRGQNQQDKVKETIQQSSVLQAFLKDQNANIVGLPFTIETNYSNVRATLTLPLTGIRLPENEDELEAYVAGLYVFVEHSDGQEVLYSGEIVYDENGMPTGIQIVIDKFSTFTMIHVPTSISEFTRFIFGFPDGTFHPNDYITRGELAALLARNMDQTIQVGEIPFSDVPISHWAYRSIQQMHAANLMIGDDLQLFHPNRFVSRAEMAVIAARWLKLTTVSTDSGYVDANNHWAAPEIAAVKQAGIMIGYTDGTFRPNELLTRAQAVVVLNRLFNRPFLDDALQGTKWSDVLETYWAYKDIESASTSFKVFDSITKKQKIIENE